MSAKVGWLLVVDDHPSVPDPCPYPRTRTRARTRDATSARPKTNHTAALCGHTQLSPRGADFYLW